MKLPAAAILATTLATTLAIVGLSTPALATGIMTCDSGDRATWKSKAELETKMKADGWREIRRIKEDGGCWEAYGTTAEGDRVEAYFHPVTLETLLIARRGQILFRKSE